MKLTFICLQLQSISIMLIFLQGKEDSEKELKEQFIKVERTPWFVVAY